MKKLNFRLTGKHSLTKDQMKKISGGYDHCHIDCWGAGGSYLGEVAVVGGCTPNETEDFILCDVAYQGVTAGSCHC